MTTAAVISRAEARAAGLKRYYTGKPCPHGHRAERWVVIGRCVVCADISKKAWIASNPERAKACKAAHYQANATEYKARAKKYAEDHPDKAKTYRASRKPQDPQRRRALEAARRKADPERFRSRVRNHRALRKAAQGTHSKNDVLSIMSNQKSKCAFCRVSLKRRRWEVDHIIPIAQGGSNGRRNLQILCLHCNRSKSARHPIDFAQANGRLL